MLGLYVHLPFCRVHCTYCAFAISTDISLQERYVDALVEEIGSRAAHEEVDTIYFGGGTPSRVSIPNLVRLTTAIREQFRVVRDAEFSIESNPEDVTGESLEAWRELGVNRVSIGVQSFDDRELEPLRRLHGRERAREALAAAVASGVRTNLDLILGLPNQTEASFRDTLETAIAGGAGHLSLYMLDLEEGTPLHAQVTRGRTRLPEDERVAALYEFAIGRLADAGLEQYEISNFARPDQECQHNLRYWTRGEYHGFGIAAHSFLGGERFANTRNIRHYIDAPAAARDFSETLGSAEVRRETIFLGLRQTSGVSYDQLIGLCGQEGIEWVERGLEDGWLRRSGARVAFTPPGFLLSNEFISQLF
jgi:putative oxygen-independent coproporphyrinogen III oxidase